MTKTKCYFSLPAENAELALIKARYLRYPKVHEQMRGRHIAYNATVQYIEGLRKQGRIFVIHPKQKSDIGRVEKTRRNWMCSMKKATAMRTTVFRICLHI